MAVWYKDAESDGYNALIVNAGLAWRDVALVRSVSRFLRQAGSPYSQDYLWASLNRHAGVAAMLVELFHARFNPTDADAKRAAAILARIEAALETVQSLDEDRIIRRFANVIEAMVRTNFFQLGAGGAPHAEINFKLDSQKVEGLPAPRPFREIFVHSPRVEAIHLRFGKVARGGIRWSDRPQDFRTEVLGLCKAQQVKNAVIVPVGAKGGFVPKQLPASGGRDEVMAEGIATYRIFISSLLDITDNLDGETVVPPEGVIRHEGDDPYLVVAADKGTATFSDIANGISADHGFWLGDAFASGGSVGYDHKKMGITARGAWEAVKRHFRELDRNIQTEPFTVVGVGDMSGDVFGNGMLLSPATKLVAAFDHRDIFIDPEPDPAASLAERRRLFDLPRSSWQDYDRTKISAGGGVFSRKEKAVRLSPEIKALLDLSADRATPQEIMQAILRARADLLWFGGIGTFVRASDEADDKVGDRANDAIRITAAELRVPVVGEGANLGMTQKARIAFGLSGGRCNTDAIDNSAGVNTSDVEVNIKIALDLAVRAGRLNTRKRNKLLAAMTDEVGGLVLRNNYLQPLAMSLAMARGFEDFGFQLRLMQGLETRGKLDRAIELLPDDAAMMLRQKEGKPLTRAEIAVLLAYAKIVLFDDLIEGDVTDDPALAVELMRYFPKRMQTQHAAEIDAHRLRREIIATMLSNSMINRGGPTYLVRIADRTGAAVPEIARAYVAVRDSFGLQALHAEIDALDNRLPGAVQLELYRAVQDLLLSRTAWFLRNVRFSGGVGPIVAAYAASFGELDRTLADLLPPHLAERATGLAARYQASGVPAKLAWRIASLPELADVTDIHLIAGEAGAPLKLAAEVFFAVAGHFQISRIEMLARALPVADYYDGLVLDRALETLAEAHRRIAAQAIAAGGAKPLDSWIAARHEAVGRTVQRVTAMTEGEAVTVSRVTVAASLLADLVRA
jgi:glutamate dehydrogenase